MSLVTVREQPGLERRGQWSYTLNGRPLMSFSKATSVLDKPALLKWSCECMARAIERAVAEAVLADPSRLWTAEEIKALAWNNLDARTDELNRAQDIGKIAHKQIEIRLNALKEGTPAPEIPPDLNPRAARVVDMFQEWAMAHKVQPLQQEWPMADPATLMFCRADTFLLIDDRPAFLDLKSANGGRVFREWELEVSCAHRIAFNAQLIQGVEPKDVQRIVLVCPKDGEGPPLPVEVTTDIDNDWDTLLAAARTRQGVPEYRGRK